MPVHPGWHELFAFPGFLRRCIRRYGIQPLRSSEGELPSCHRESQGASWLVSGGKQIEASGCTGLVTDHVVSPGGIVKRSLAMVFSTPRKSHRQELCP